MSHPLEFPAQNQEPRTKNQPIVFKMRNELIFTRAWNFYRGGVSS